jgi:hypothetical protein
VAQGQPDSGTDAGRLLAELVYLRDKGVPGVTEDDPQLRTLLEIAKRRYPAARSRRTHDLLHRLLDDAVNRDMMQQYSSEGLVALLQGLGAARAESDLWRPGKREGLAAETAGTLYATYRKPAARRRRLADIARAITELAESQVPADDDSTLEVAETYVRRRQPEQRFLELIKEHAPVIAVAGLPSVGKRAFVRQLTREYSPRSSAIVRLDGSSTEALSDSMLTFLHKAGALTAKVDYTALLGSLLEYLRSNEVRFVVIEEAHDVGLATLLASARPGAITVVVTTTKQLSGLDRDRHIELGELEEQEAVELIQKTLPGTSNEDAALLAEDLGCHVLALVVACGMIVTHGRGEVAGFRHGLRQNLPFLLDTSTEEYPALTSLYRQVLEELAQNEPVAFAALELVMFLDYRQIPSAYVVYGIGQRLGLRSPSEAHARSLAGAGLLTLRNRYLITVEEGFVTLPSLGRTIMRDLCNDRGAAICADTRAGILAVCGLVRADRAEQPLMDFVQAHMPLFHHVHSTFVNPRGSGGPRSHLLLHSQALEAFLIAIGEEPWRIGLLTRQTASDRFETSMFEVPEWADGETDLHLPVRAGSVQLELVARGWAKRKRMLRLLLGLGDAITFDELRS